MVDLGSGTKCSKATMQAASQGGAPAVHVGNHAWPQGGTVKPQRQSILKAAEGMATDESFPGLRSTKKTLNATGSCTDRVLPCRIHLSFHLEDLP